MPKSTRLTLCDKVVSDLRQVSTAVSSTEKKTDRHDIAVTLLKEKLKI